LCAWVRATGIQDGILTLMVQHTSASLTIQENADPDVQKDLTDHLTRLAPKDMSLYRHTCEGPDDMPAHIKSALTDVSISIPVMKGAPRLGTWQGVYLAEHRDAPHSRKIAVHLIGE
jgi:secondary thiamine-phosphate synthase enzyme